MPEIEPYFDPYIVRLQFGGNAFNFVIGDRTGKEWYDGPGRAQMTREDALAIPMTSSREGNLGWRELEILRDRLALPGSHIVECGTHHGLMTVMMAGWVGPTGFVSTFDAVHENITIVKNMLALNHVDNVAAYCAAIGGDFGIMQMRDTSNIVILGTANRSPHSALMVRVSSLLDGPPDALKIDIEGAELGMIEAEKDFIAKVPRLAIEVHTDMLPEDGIERLVTALGDRPIHVLWNDNRFTPYDGGPIRERVHFFSW